MNSVFLKQLRDLKCDVDGAMERCLNDEEFYRKCFETVMEDGNFKMLGEALERENVQEAFECAHTLKGVLGNMGLTPLYELLVPIVESLRAGIIKNLDLDYQKFMREYEKFQQLLEK